ncbi:hypothetical protein WNY59_02040 [Ahrensia kielensis]|uniref:Uncharacterized protein n=1 Tax=Ahrensia kielensis TaxID=76980 RepID=A0ABU9T2L0_9HYPH
MTLPAAAKDGAAWGGKCILTHSGDNITSSSCSSEGTTCEGNGTGGTSCNVSITAKQNLNPMRGTAASGAVKEEAVAGKPMPTKGGLAPVIPEAPFVIRTPKLTK